MKKLFCYILLLAFIQIKAQHIAFINATAHVGDGQVIDNSIVTIHNSTIEMVGSVVGLKMNPAAYDTVIDLAGMHIYPALINTDNVLGLHDAEAVRATNDYAEVGVINPHVRSLIAYNTDNLIVPTIKTNGVLYTQVCPRGGLVSGSSSIVQLEGWNWEDALLKADDGIHMNYPRAVMRKEGEDEKQFTAAVKKYQADILHLDRFFAEARAYLAEPAKTEKNLRFEAVRAVMEGKARLYLHTDRAKDILSAIDFARKHTIALPVIVGGRESYRVTSELRKNKIPVMLNRVNDLPERADDDVDIIFRLPYLLQKDSVLFCLQLEGDMEAMHSRNLPFNAGVAVGYGLTKEQALSAITLNAAKIIGVEDKIGSLTGGKLASLVVSTGDLLDMRSNNIILAYLSGKKVQLRNHQTVLYEKYKTKYGIR
jgi:imidazolonepropionase-like amidohydrolase